MNGWREFAVLLAPMGLAAVAGLLLPRRDGTVPGWLRPFAALSFLATMVLLFPRHPGIPTVEGCLMLDGTARFFAFLICGTALLSLAASYPYNEGRGIREGESVALLSIGTGAMVLLACATELMTAFLCLETAAICIYTMFGADRASRTSGEAGLKTLLHSAFATAILVYGMTFVYGLTGETRIAGIGSAAIAGKTGWIACALLVTGLAFKVGLAPLHTWVPDAYEGAPTPAATFASTGLKVAGFALALRMLGAVVPPDPSGWIPFLWFLAVLSMTVGNLAALGQRNFKRMLAYSSVAHGGYALLAIVGPSGTDPAIGPTSPNARFALCFYLIAYVLMTGGAFVVLAGLRREGKALETRTQLRGLGRRAPLPAILLSTLLISLAGIPPTFGFLAKVLVIMQALQSQFTELAVIAAINSLVALGYYIGWVVTLFLREPEPEESRPVPLHPATAFAGFCCAAGAVLLGMVPGVWSLLGKALGQVP